MTRAPEAVPADTLAAIAGLVEAHSGLRFIGGRRSELASKTARAFAESGCRSWDAYLHDLSRQPASPLRDRLLEALTVGESYFFRDATQLELLATEILPSRLASHGADKP